MEFLIRILGPVEVHAGEHWSALGSVKERNVLAALAMDAGRAVSVDTLVDRVWGDEPPGKPRDALYVYVSRLRRSLQSVAGPAAPLLERRTHTYVLQAERPAVDLHRYNALIDRAHAVARRGDGHGALRLLHDAQELLRGEPLAGLPGTWAADIRAAQEERTLDAVMLQAGVALRLGQHSDLVPRLTRLADAHPTNETLLVLLAVALYGTGQTVRAADLMRRFLRGLAQEFGTAPGARLRAVQQGILNGVPVAELLSHAPGLPSDVETVRTPESADNLPRDIEWIGREAEIARLTGTTAEPRGAAPVVALEAVDGMAGVGKTSLAVHIAHLLRPRYPDGAVFLDLGTFTAVDTALLAQILRKLLHLLGVPAARMPRHPEALAAAWRAALAERRMIVVLDNVLAAEQVRPLLPGPSSSLVILTSRRRLTDLSGVRPVSLDVLPLPEAISMFQRRVGAERAPNTEETARIVRLCGLLPLAIEIIASRFLSRPSWSAAELVRLLADASSRVPEIRDGQRELASAFEVSYRALTPLQRMVFRRLGAHLGPEFGSHAAAALCGLSLRDTERALEGLLACHLLEEPSPHRYRLHDLLRDYAQGLAAAEDSPAETDRAITRLADFYLTTADLADRQAYPFRCRVDTGLPHPAPAPRDVHGDPSQWFVTEGPNLLAALTWSTAHRPARDTAMLAHVLAGFLDTEGYLATAEAELRGAAGYWQGSGDRAAYACALLDLCVICLHAGHYTEAGGAAEAALGVARESGDTETVAEAHHQLGICAWHRGRYAESVSHHRAALALRSGGPALQHARSLNGLGIVLLDIGEHEQARAAFSEALRKFREVRDARGELRTLNNLGEVRMKLGDLDGAGSAYRQALALARQATSRVDGATLQMNTATVLLASGQPDRALDLYREALPVLRSVGDQRNEAIALHGIGTALQAAGRLGESISHHTAALAVARQIGAAHEEAEILRDLGIVEHRIGRLAPAGRHLRASLAIAERIQALPEETATLNALADLRWHEGAAQEADLLRARARALQDRRRLP